MSRKPQTASREPRENIKNFFEKYEKGANTFDPDLVTSCYAEYFTAATPKGQQPGQNGDKFRAVIPVRKKFFEQVGFQSAKIKTMHETRLDNNYAMVKIHWHMQFKKDEKLLDVEFDITYLVFSKAKKTKIVFYISHVDEEETMRKLGLIKA